VEHGEHPAESVVREFADLTGLVVKVDRLLDVGSDHRQLASGIDFHGVFAVFGVTVVGGTLRTTADGPLEAPVWTPLSALPETPLLDSVREIILNHQP
jgi:ADP-ribose pyrophosphatase YjhB (NUDIX family)